MRLLPTLGVIAGFCCYALVAPAQEATDAAVNAPDASVEWPKAGEIMLTGSVLKVDGKTGGLTIHALQFTLPGPKTAAINPPKDKVVVIDASTFIHERGTKEPRPLTAIVLPGAQVQVIGPDSGSGKTLLASEIVVLAGAARAERNGAKPGVVELAKPVDLRLAAVSDFLSDAQEIVAGIKETPAKLSALQNLAAAQVHIGDAAAAKLTIRAILKLVDTLPDANAKMLARRDAAVLQFRVGDTVGAAQGFAAAKQQAQQFDDPNVRPGALAYIAAAQAHAGDATGAVQTFDVANQAVQQLTNDYSKACALAEVTRALADAGNLVAARQTAARIDEHINPSFAYQKSVALWGVAEAQARAKDIGGALQTADAVTDDYLKMRALVNVEVAQVDIGDVAGARQTTTRLTDPFLKSLALSNLAIGQAKRGDIAGAQQTVQGITDVQEKLYAERAIVAAQARTGDGKGAKAAWDSAARIFDAGEKDATLTEIAVVLAEAGRTDLALLTVEQLTSASSKVSALTRIAEITARAVKAGAAKP